MISDKSSCYALCSITLLCCLKFGNSRDFATRKCEDLDLQNDMRFFDRSTRQFIHWLQRDSPDEIFKEVIGNWNNKTANVKSKIANYEWPFFLVCGILFFSAFATSVTGFGIILYKKFQKTNRHDKSVEKSDKSGTDRYMFILAIVSCFLILTDVCLFISNNHLSEDLPRARETLISSVDDLQNFQNSTVQELDHILRDDFDREVGGSLNQFRALADCSTGGLHSILTKRQVHFNKASESALSGLYKTRDMLSRINMTLGALHDISTGLRSELGKMNLYFKEAKRLCSSSQQIISEDVCKKFVNEKDIFSRQLPQEVSNNVTEVTSRLNTFLKNLNFSSVNKILKSQEDIERTLCEERSGKLKELEKLCFGIRIARSFTLDTVKKYSNQLAEHSLVPMKNKIQRALGTDGNIGQYDRKRWWLSFVVVFAVLLASLTTLISLVLKQVEPFISRLPSNITLMMELKTWFPLLPKRLLLSSTIVHLSMAVVVNLCAGMSFLVVSNMALVCDMSSHYEKLDDLFGTSDLLKESRLFAKEEKSLKLFKKISECPEDGTLWAMFNLDEKFNINDGVNRLNGIPRLADRFFQDGSVFDRRKGKQLQAFYKVLQEWRDIGLANININILTEQVNNPMLDKSFQKLSEALLSSYQHTDENKEHVTRMPFKMFRSISNQASVIEDNYVKMNSVLSKLLNQHLKSFNKSRERVVASFANMNDIYSDIAGDSITQSEHEVVDHQVIKTVEVIKNFMKDSFSKMRSEVGKCGPMKHAYNRTVCLFCRDLFGSWNSWWILLLVCGFFTILSTILCFLTLKHFQTTALELENEARERRILLNSRKDLQEKYNVTEEDLQRFIKLIQAIADQGFSDEWVDRWNFIGALFFSGTVVTTIGYGHLAPTTNSGRIFCIFYALIGIPLTWTLLARLGYMISCGVSAVITIFERRFLQREPSKVGLKSTLVTFLMASAMILLIAGIAHYSERWSFLDGIYFGFITLSTIGFGDLVPLHPRPGEDTVEYATHVTVFTIMTLLYFTIGLAIVSSMMLSISAAMEDPSLLGFHRVANTDQSAKCTDRDFD